MQSSCFCHQNVMISGIKCRFLNRNEMGEYMSKKAHATWAAFAAGLGFGGFGAGYKMGLDANKTTPVANVQSAPQAEKPAIPSSLPAAAPVPAVDKILEGRNQDVLNLIQQIKDHPTRADLADYLGVQKPGDLAKYINTPTLGHGVIDQQATPLTALDYVVYKAPIAQGDNAVMSYMAKELIDHGAKPSSQTYKLYARRYEQAQQTYKELSTKKNPTQEDIGNMKQAFDTPGWLNLFQQYIGSQFPNFNNVNASKLDQPDGKTTPAQLSR
jgi:hypothetical protein